MFSLRRLFHTIAVPALFVSITQAMPSYSQTSVHLTL
jgi:hypothetical protein